MTTKLIMGIGAVCLIFSLGGAVLFYTLFSEYHERWRKCVARIDTLEDSIDKQSKLLAERSASINAILFEMFINLVLQRAKGDLLPIELDKREEWLWDMHQRYHVGASFGEMFFPLRASTVEECGLELQRREKFNTGNPEPKYDWRKYYAYKIQRQPGGTELFTEITARYPEPGIV